MTGRKVIVVNVFALDPEAIGRGPTGAPRLDGDTQQYQLFLAAPTENGWTLETWYPEDSEIRQDVDLIPNLDHLTTRIAATLAVEEGRPK